jgi:FkbM family methyltransferase
MPEIRTRYGVISVPDTESDLIGRFLAQYGEWAWNEVMFISSIIPDGARVLDIGAFIGTFTLGLSILRKLDFACLVEAHKVVIPHLTENIHRHSEIPAVIVEALAAETKRELRAGWGEADNLGSISFLTEDRQTGANYIDIEPPTRVVTLTELRETYGDFDLIKIDAEGMETEILSAERMRLADGSTTLWVECAEHPRSIELGEWLLSLCQPLYYFAFGSYNPENFLQNSSPIYAFAFEAGLLAAPRIEPVLASELRARGCILRRIETQADLKRALWDTPRWGFPEWHGAPAEKIVASAGHQLLGQHIDTFLTPPLRIGAISKPRSATEVLRLRVQALEETRRAAEALAEDARYAAARQMQADRDRIADLERRLEQAGNAAARQMQANRDTITDLERRLEEAVNIATEQRKELLGAVDELRRTPEAIVQSTTWRLARPVSSKPRLHRGLRRSVQVAERIIRRGATSLNLDTAKSGDPGSVDRHHVRSLFDGEYYLNEYPDIRAAGVDPLGHFMEQGWKEKRNPNREFNTAFYLRSNPDVVEAGVNPFLHYIRTGAAQGRKPRPAANAAFLRQLDSARSSSLQARDWLSASRKRADLSIAAVTAALLDSAGCRQRLVVSVSHDDYALAVGGVQNVIGDEQTVFRAADWGYLHLSPQQCLPLLAPVASSEDFLFLVRLDGQALGIASAASILAALRTVISRCVSLRFIVHHFMGHAPELLSEIAVLIDPKNRVVWVHDFFTLCPNYLLLRNDIAFCGAPPLTSPACGICVYGDDRREHLKRLNRFFQQTMPRMIAPSQPTAELWKRAVCHPYSDLAVVALCHLNLNIVLPPPEVAHRPLRVAFGGWPAFQKGWMVFADLASRHRDDQRYSFFHFGVAHGPRAINVSDVEVRVTPENRNAMIDALRRERIDVVIIWSIWPETFSFTAHEALAAGAFVVTARGAGNVGRVIAANNPQQGLVLDDEAALFDQFTTGDIRTRVQASHRRGGHLDLARGTADFWLAEEERSL